MRRPPAVFPITLALGAIILAPGAGAQERERTEIEKCQTINEQGSYKLVNNLTAPASGNSDCLVVTTDFVTINLAGFTISGPGVTGILATRSSGQLQGIAVRNGSISAFANGVDLSSADGSIVEGLRIVGVAGPPMSRGINANGIVKGNTVADFNGFRGTGIAALGTITGNYVDGNEDGIIARAGSTVIGNAATGNVLGITVACPANVTNNTAVNNTTNLILQGTGCNNTNNVAP